MVAVDDAPREDCDMSLATPPSIFAFALLVLAPGALPAQEPSLATRWSDAARVPTPRPEHPRPRLVRESWQSLNGAWDLAIVERFAAVPEEFDREVRVPFPLESALSGVGEPLRPDQRAYYRRDITVPTDWAGQRVLLHCAAVDWECEVLLDGQPIGRPHQGGYTPFTVDLTGHINFGDDHELVLSVWDPTDAGNQPVGKQTLNPHGIWYTGASGVWGSVWLEAVPEQGIEEARVRASFDPEQPDRGMIGLELEPAGAAWTDQHFVRVRITEGDRRVAELVQADPRQPIRITIARPKAWSPEDPQLYGIELSLHVGENTAAARQLDSVRSYTAFRHVAVHPDPAGVPRIHLNGEPRFLLGLLDQGFWPDGIYTAPSDAALRFDIGAAKELGFDTLRKHVKVEPERWYHHCDQLGILVLQDIVGGGARIRPDQADLENVDAHYARRFEQEMRATMQALDHYPSIVGWVVFNEGWGQHETARYAKLANDLDPTRIIDAVSGWADRGVGDLYDMHNYPGPGSPPVEKQRAAFLGEFGGFGLVEQGHLWNPDRRNWGYRNLQTRDELTDRYVDCLNGLFPLWAKGLSGAIYTQLTDVEIEVNGLYTYDRAVLKPDAARLKALHARFRGAPPQFSEVLPTSQSSAQTWRMTTTEPGGDWTATDFDDSTWKSAPGGFGTANTPGAVVGTRWDGQQIWLRRAFTVDQAVPAGAAWLSIHHDEDAEVYLDGQRIAAFDGWTSSYLMVPLPEVALSAGAHTLAVHCKQTDGGQFVDVGILRVEAGR